MEKEILSILMVTPHTAESERIQESLLRSKIAAKIRFVLSNNEAIRLLGQKKFDLLLTDHDPPNANVLTLLMMMKKNHFHLPVIVIAKECGIEVVREAFKMGVDDYILKEELDTVALFHIIGTALEKRKSRDELLEAQKKLKELAERDGLTNLYNHRWFLETLEREFARCRRYWRPLSLLMVDLDGFKLINDSCGHPKGDLVLKNIASMLQETVRSVDSTARYGGDEFAILLPETDAKSAYRLGERILKKIKSTPFCDNNEVFPLSASIGVGSFHPTLTSAGLLLKEADQSLYQAKKEGRGMVAYLKPTQANGEEDLEVPMSIAALQQDPPEIHT